jgi:hypothetical protein
MPFNPVIDNEMKMNELCQSEENDNTHANLALATKNEALPTPQQQRQSMPIIKEQAQDSSPQKR